MRKTSAFGELLPTEMSTAEQVSAEAKPVRHSREANAKPLGMPNYKTRIKNLSKKLEELDLKFVAVYEEVIRSKDLDRMKRLLRSRKGLFRKVSGYKTHTEHGFSWITFEYLEQGFTLPFGNAIVSLLDTAQTHPDSLSETVVTFTAKPTYFRAAYALYYEVLCHQGWEQWNTDSSTYVYDNLIREIEKHVARASSELKPVKSMADLYIEEGIDRYNEHYSHWSGTWEDMSPDKKAENTYNILKDRYAQILENYNEFKTSNSK